MKRRKNGCIDRNISIMLIILVVVVSVFLIKSLFCQPPEMQRLLNYIKPLIDEYTEEAKKIKTNNSSFSVHALKDILSPLYEYNPSPTKIEKALKTAQYYVGSYNYITRNLPLKVLYNIDICYNLAYIHVNLYSEYEEGFFLDNTTSNLLHGFGPKLEELVSNVNKFADSYNGYFDKSGYLQVIEHVKCSKNLAALEHNLLNLHIATLACKNNYHSYLWDRNAYILQDIRNKLNEFMLFS